MGVASVKMVQNRTGHSSESPLLVSWIRDQSYLFFTPIYKSLRSVDFRMTHVLEFVKSETKL